MGLPRGLRMHVGIATAICVTLLASFGSVQVLLAPSEKGFLAPRAQVALAEQSNPVNPLASGQIGAGPLHRVWIRRDRQAQLFEWLAKGAVVRLSLIHIRRCLRATLCILWWPPCHHKIKIECRIRRIQRARA